MSSVSFLLKTRNDLDIPDCIMFCVTNNGGNVKSIVKTQKLHCHFYTLVYKECRQGTSPVTIEVKHLSESSSQFFERVPVSCLCF